MHWLNIHSSTLDSEAFLGSDPREQATWLKLLRFCIGQENGGVIRGAKTWNDRRWQHLVRVSRKEVLRECGLWDWHGDDLKVQFYPVDKELEVKEKRAAALSTHAKRQAKHDAEHDAERPEKGREGKGNGMKSEGNTPPTNRPSFENAVEYFSRNGSDYTTQEIRDVWNSFEATIQGGLWFFGKRPVGDWPSAMETRLSDNRKKTSPGTSVNGHPAGWQEGDDECWWNWDLPFLESAAAGAWSAGDKTKAARMDAIIALRKGGR